MSGSSGCSRLVRLIAGQPIAGTPGDDLTSGRQACYKGAGQRKEDTITAKIFVGNLNYETVESDLEVLFSEVGDVVEVFLPVDRNSGRPRGFAFVEFADPDAVAEAIEKFDGHELKGREIRVNEAEARPSRPSRPSFNSGGPGGAGGYQGQKKPKPKGSRRKIRGRKRSL